ncbi:MORN_motif [Hexamita inflata]|uniref:MORN motif n=1 Tax=Hexamita inflata TaxID=28002 RepID=A0AA86RF78_9EUKA|nr:MORN motif [Hexamita inflata]
MTDNQTIISESYQYVGQVSYERMHGKGILMLNDGSYYVGQFFKNHFSGEGTYVYKETSMTGTFANGDFYSGTLKHNDQLYVIDRGLYKEILPYYKNLQNEHEQIQETYKQVTFSDSKNNKRIISYENGRMVVNAAQNTSVQQMLVTPEYIYIGYIINGQMSGQGTLIFNDGNIYNGKFLQNRFSGLGTFTFSSGAVMKGQFKDGDFQSGLLNKATGPTVEVVGGNWQCNFANRNELNNQNLQNYYTTKQDKSKVIKVTDLANQCLSVQFNNGILTQTQIQSARNQPLYSISQSQLVSTLVEQKICYNQSPQSPKEQIDNKISQQQQLTQTYYKNLVTQNKELKASKFQLEKEVQKLNTDNQALKFQIEELQKQLQQQENEIIQLKAQIDEQNKTIDLLQQQIKADNQSENFDQKNENVRLSEQLFKIQQILLITNNELQEQKQQNTKIYKEVQDKESQIVTLKQDLNRIQIQQHKLKQQNLIQSQSKNIQEINQKESQSQTQLIQHLQSQHKLLEEENSQLIMSLQKQKTRHEDNLLVLEEQINMQKESNSMEQEKQLMIQEQQLKDYEFEKQQLIQKYTDEMNKQLGDHQRDKQQLQNKLDKELNDIKQAFEEEKQKLVQSHNQLQNQAKTEFDQKLDKIQKQCESQISALKQQNQSAIQEYQQQLQQSKTEQKNFQTKTEQYAIQIQNDVKTKIESETTRITKECNNEKQKLTNDFNSQKQALQLQNNDLQKQIQVQLNQITEQSSQIEKLTQHLEQNITQNEILNTQNNTLEQQIESFKEQIAVLQNQLIQQQTDIQNLDSQLNNQITLNESLNSQIRNHQQINQKLLELQKIPSEHFYRFVPGTDVNQFINEVNEYEQEAIKKWKQKMEKKEQERSEENVNEERKE